MTTQLIDEAILDGPFSAALDLRGEEVRPDYVRIRLPFSLRITTLADIVHGGAIGTLIDTAATVAAWSGVDDPEAHRGTTIGFSVSFLAAARGVDLVAEARVTQRGRSICFVDVAVHDTRGTSIATGQVSYKLSRLSSPEETMAGLFSGLEADEQRALLARLERPGAALYRAWAEAERDPERRAELLAAAEREEANAGVLER
jgi:uncharacterized protein (TIGR00369 family)